MPKANPIRGDPADTATQDTFGYRGPPLHWPSLSPHGWQCFWPYCPRLSHETTQRPLAGFNMYCYGKWGLEGRLPLRRVVLAVASACLPLPCGQPGQAYFPAMVMAQCGFGIGVIA